MTRCNHKVDTVNQCKKDINHKRGLCWMHDPDQHFICKGIYEDGTRCKIKLKTDKLCKNHDDSSIKKLFQCVAILKEGLNKGNRCSSKIKNEGGVCGIHPTKEIHHIKHEEKKCSECNTLVEWKSMDNANFDHYDISSIGEIYSYKSNRFLEGFLKVDGYISFDLTDNNGKRLKKNVNTFQGIVFFDLPLVNEGITMDHIDGNRSNNRICCNLRVATRVEQARNRKLPKAIRGKIVLKISLDNENVIEEYSSAVEAADKIGHISIHSMRRICRLELDYKGYLWRYKKKEDYDDIKWISSTKEFPKMILFEGSEEGYIALSYKGYISKGSKTSDDYMNMGIEAKG